MMSNFTDLRNQVAGTRAQADSNATRLAVAREQLKDVQREIADLQRVANAQTDPRGPARLAELEKQAGALTQQIDRLRQETGRLKAQVGDLLGQLLTTDPAQQIEELNDGLPIMLFPVRLETRFHVPSPSNPLTRSVVGVATAPQLWIRIYPDDCQIDSFEELLTKTELDNAREFWASMWRAASVEAQERGAWRSLVAGSGSGRATYIVRQYAPTNMADKPVKVDPQDVVLVIIPGIDVTPTEQTAAFDYYTAVWRADGDKGAEDSALATFQAAVGNARADAIRAQFAPEANGQDPPKPYKRAQVRVSCAVLKLPPPPPSKTTAWTQGPKATALPDRFVALLFNGGVEVQRVVGGPVSDGLAVGPDPSLPPDQQIKKDGDDLVLNDDLLWMADFERAVAVGMGIRVNLAPAEASTGFDRLVVLGLRFSSDEKDSKKRLETLIAHHYSSTHGFSLVPQGSPTNNTESEGAGYSWVDVPDASYDAVFKGKETYAETDDVFQRRDGQWLAEALGIDDAILKVVPNAAGHDQGEARAMNVALWQATLGYMMEEMMTPIFSRADIAATRWFFTRYVSGRGPIPAIRVGRQPYGILPVMAFSRYSSGRETGGVFLRMLADGDYLQRLHTLLLRLDSDWRQMSASVAHVGQPGDKHQTLLDVVGLHSGSVEYHQRYAESFDQLFNKLVYEYGQELGGLIADWLKLRSQELLAGVGADPNAPAPILEKFFYGQGTLLQGRVVDDGQLSETKPVRAYTPDKKNYIEWLATSSLDVIRRQDFGGNPEPTALLYLLLRHAIMLGHWDTAIRMLESHALVDAALERREPAFIHVQSAAGAGKSKFQHLYAPRPEITGNSTTTLGEYILLPSVLRNAVETVDLREILAALDFLKGTSTAALERLFAEHIDCCTYRLDAWKNGLTAARLEEMRARRGEESPRGLYLGAYAWLEDLRPNPQLLSPVNLDPDLAAVFQRPKDAPLQHDPQNSGYIHAPSLNHAAAAAILKNAYKVNASPANPDAMAVNLSSDRVRRAMEILEGIRNGQTLPALLGYRFERGLHDEHNLAEVDKFIYPLRQAFPLVAKQLKSTAPDNKTDITLLEARNVIDGVKLVEQIRTSGQKSYPFGMPSGPGPDQLPPASAQEQTAINAEADALLNLYDALGDLVMAESVYQVVQGNFDRAAANTTAFSKGGHPPQVEVVNTPRNGVSLTHRVAIHLDADADPGVSPSSVPMTPRSRAEAPLNLWLAGRLPDPADVVVRVTYTSPALSAPRTNTFSQQDLALQPIDLLFLANLDLDQAQSELDDRIVQLVRYGADAHPDISVTIEYTQPVAGKVTFMELAPLVRSLRVLALKSRPVAPADMVMPLETQTDDGVWDDAQLTGRVQQAISTLVPLRDSLVALEADASDLDTYARKVSEAFLQAALYGMPQTGTGHIHADIRSIYDAIAKELDSFARRWAGKSTDYATLMATWPGLTTDADRLAMLQKAEGLIASSTTAPLPADPIVYKASVEATKLKFDGRLTQINNLLKFAGNKLVDFASAADTLRPALAEHDAVPFDIADQKTAMSSLRDTLVARVKAVADDVSKRIQTIESAIAAAATLTNPADRVQQLRTAAHTVLGDEMQIVPRFKLGDDSGLEFSNCIAGASALLDDLKAAGRRFPVDDWLYGLARVREKMNAWESVAVLSEALGSSLANLSAVQLPFTPGDRWLGLEFDPAKAGPANRLLYTAHFSVPFNRTAEQCGLLLDEWPELVPGTDVTSGVTFHFDRPSSQPPQAILLVVPAALKGRWLWNDLVDSINGTLDAAKARGVEPAQIDASAYAQFLPATLMAVTLYQIHIATNLAMNNRIYEMIRS
jgi:hypothetical protein